MVRHGALHVKPIMGQLRAMTAEPLFFRLRLPEDLKSQIEASAKANGRSMNAEVLSRLERSFDLDDGLTALADRVEELEAISTEQSKQIERLEQLIDDVRVATHQYDPNGPD